MYKLHTQELKYSQIEELEDPHMYRYSGVYITLKINTTS